jgi:hypothetical protein
VLSIVCGLYGVKDTRLSAVDAVGHECIVIEVSELVDVLFEGVDE